MARSEFKRYRNNKILDLAGVYIIYSTQSVKNGIYIGEGDDVSARLRKHDSDKDFWDELLIFTSERMNVAFSKNIEFKFISKARTSSKYPIDNSVKGGKRKLGKDDRDLLNQHIKNYYKIVELANIDVFEFNKESIFSCESYGHNIKVKVVDFTNREILVLSGSIIGRAFKDEVSLVATQYEVLENGDYKLIDNIAITLNSSFDRVFGAIHTTALKNENTVSLCGVLD